MKKLSVLIFLAFAVACSNDVPENSDKVETILYLGEGDNQPLLVGLGGSEGGNAWTSDRWQAKRDAFISKGYAFLAVGYFGAKGTSEVLDRISIDAIHKAIIDSSKNPKIDGNKIALIGGSKGAELALLLASHFEDISCVIALVPSHCSFPALTLTASTSSWTYKGEEVPYVPMPWAAVPSAMNRDLLSAFTIMLEDKAAVEKALIKVENINGPILLLSAKKDEMWPSTKMSNEMVLRLKQYEFGHPYQHIAIDGGHTDVVDHFDKIFNFLGENFPTD
ncbi:MAG: acyl-CoA thioester hydrolase/BAAT C-terminal domain-containing protein [Imperialibacter sp.]|uniref:acyl-CoA thioester hydrolase/BAAT C-terminal domain-containing protein n=1 Tax=Imperialibacter sp. TaxID=2038411 RepID=UPI0032EDA0C9